MYSYSQVPIREGIRRHAPVTNMERPQTTDEQMSSGRLPSLSIVTAEMKVNTTLHTPSRTEHVNGSSCTPAFSKKYTAYMKMTMAPPSSRRMKMEVTRRTGRQLPGSFRARNWRREGGRRWGQI